MGYSPQGGGGGAATSDIKEVTIIKSSTTTSAGAGTFLTLVDTALTQADDYWNNMAVVLLSGSYIGQVRRISDFDAASDTITVDTAFGGIVASGIEYAILGQYAPASGGMTSTDIGVRQVFEKSITVAADAGATTVGTVTTQACVIESVIIHADTGQTSDLTSCAVTGAAGSVTFIPASIATQANLDTADNQVAWTGAVRLAATKTIVITPVGTGATALDLTVIVTYYSSSADGGTIS